MIKSTILVSTNDTVLPQYLLKLDGSLNHTKVKIHRLLYCYKQRDSLLQGKEIIRIIYDDELHEPGCETFFLYNEPLSATNDIMPSVRMAYFREKIWSVSTGLNELDSLFQTLVDQSQFTIDTMLDRGAINRLLQSFLRRKQ